MEAEADMRARGREFEGRLFFPSCAHKCNRKSRQFDMSRQKGKEADEGRTET